MGDHSPAAAEQIVVSNDILLREGVNSSRMVREDRIGASNYLGEACARDVYRRGVDSRIRVPSTKTQAKRRDD